MLAQRSKEHETRAMLDGQIHDIGKVGETISQVKEQLEADLISRQGVHDMIKRCNHTLEEYESRLHLVEKFLCIRKQVQKIKELAVGYNAGEITEISNKILEEL